MKVKKQLEETAWWVELDAKGNKFLKTESPIDFEFLKKNKFKNVRVTVELA